MARAGCEARARKLQLIACVFFTCTVKVQGARAFHTVRDSLTVLSTRAWDGSSPPPPPYPVRAYRSYRRRSVQRDFLNPTFSLYNEKVRSDLLMAGRIGTILSRVPALS